MAREHARILCRIWRDPEFRALSFSAQWLYMTLVSQPTVNNAGVLPLTPRAWARLSSDTTEAMVVEALSELAKHDFVVVDEDTAEVLVRSFIRNDGVATNMNVLKNALKVAVHVQSDTLRHALAGELRRLGREDAVRVAAMLEHPSGHDPALFPPPETGVPNGVEDAVSNGVGDGVPDGVATTRGEGEGVSKYVTSPEVVKDFGRRAKRATRIPDDFTVTQEMVTWARRKVPHVDGKYETEKFILYWQSASGQKATKLDWAKAWRMWMLKAGEQRGRPRGDNPNNWADN